jgi:uncharacterized lipoprotein YddW (UPF0748 family)
MTCTAYAATAILVSYMPAAGPDWPSPPREFRAVWVATVANIDWPSQKGLSTDQQKRELLAILDRCVELRLNAVIFQVRPMADALYVSRLEPWSEYLTGKLGQAPEPAYDPLELAVREAHARGLELHAWFNPFRARHPSATSPVPADHLIKSRPDLARPYGKHFWLNPTNPEVQDHSLRVILNVVRRYDVDGIHLDDYFYPYKENGPDKKPLPFPDDDTWTAYQKADGKLSRDDWRRAAINRFVERLYHEVKSTKPLVKVGISPFGIWRPGNPPGIAGLDQYAELYADPRRWFNEGWVDYLAPQLYWPIKQEKQSYPKLLAWWVGENTKARHLWPGNYTSRVTGAAAGWPASEIANQVRATRAQQGATGNIHFSMKSLLRNSGGVAEVLKELYAEPALVPASPWLAKAPPDKPRLDWQMANGARSLEIKPGGANARLLVVRTLDKGKWTLRIHPHNSSRALVLPFEAVPQRIVVTAIDRAGCESEPSSAAR